MPFDASKRLREREPTSTGWLQEVIDFIKARVEHASPAKSTDLTDKNNWAM